MLEKSKVQELLSLNQDPGLKVSLSLPTHRTQPDNKQDPIVFKNLIAQTEKKLLETLNQAEADVYLDKLEEIQTDRELFNTTLEGLLIYVTKNNLETVKIPQPLKESVVVDKILNLMPLMAYHDKYQQVHAIDIRKDSYGYYLIDQYGKEKIELDHIIDEFTNLYDDFDADSTLNFSSTGSWHGHRSSGEEIDMDRVKYFRYLNREFSEFFTDNKLPIVVFGTTENVAEFKKLTDFDVSGIEKPLKDMNQEELTSEIKEFLKHENKENRDFYENKLAHAYEQRLVSNDLEAIKEDMTTGKVGILLIKDEHEAQYNQLILDSQETGVEVHFLDTIKHPVVAINRY